MKVLLTYMFLTGTFLVVPDGIIMYEILVGVTGFFLVKTINRLDNIEKDQKANHKEMMDKINLIVLKQAVMEAEIDHINSWVHKHEME